jgi:hypothetical protein
MVPPAHQNFRFRTNIPDIYMVYRLILSIFALRKSGNKYDDGIEGRMALISSE